MLVTASETSVVGYRGPAGPLHQNGRIGPTWDDPKLRQFQW